MVIKKYCTIFNISEFLLLALLSLHPLANSTPILKGSNSNKLKQDNDEFKELDNAKINTGQMNVASKGSKSVMNKCDDPVTADKENITPVGKSKIPVFATPNANRPSLLRYISFVYLQPLILLSLPTSCVL